MRQGLLAAWETPPPVLNLEGYRIGRPRIEKDIPMGLNGNERALSVNLCLEQEEPNWLALTDSEVFDLYHAIENDNDVSGIAFRLLQMMRLDPPKLVPVH